MHRDFGTEVPCSDNDNHQFIADFRLSLRRSKKKRTVENLCALIFLSISVQSRLSPLAAASTATELVVEDAFIAFTVAGVTRIAAVPALAAEVGVTAPCVGGAAAFAFAGAELAFVRIYIVI